MFVIYAEGNFFILQTQCRFPEETGDRDYVKKIGRPLLGTVITSQVKGHDTSVSGLVTRYDTYTEKSVKTVCPVSEMWIEWREVSHRVERHEPMCTQIE